MLRGGRREHSRLLRLRDPFFLCPCPPGDHLCFWGQFPGGVCKSCSMCRRMQAFAAGLQRGQRPPSLSSFAQCREGSLGPSSFLAEGWPLIDYKSKCPSCIRSDSPTWAPTPDSSSPGLRCREGSCADRRGALAAASSTWTPTRRSLESGRELGPVLQDQAWHRLIWGAPAHIPMALTVPRPAARVSAQVWVALSAGGLGPQEGLACLGAVLTQ